MPRRWSFLCLLILSVLVAIARAEEKEGFYGQLPALEKHKPGSQTLDTPGVPGDWYFTVMAGFGVDPPPDVLQAYNEAVKKGAAEVWVPVSYPESGSKSSYLVEVPSNYDPDMPHGILVWVDSGDRSGIPVEYRSVLEKYHLIGASAAGNGNPQATIVRTTRALHAVEMLKKAYNIDDDRIYVSGRSGGGRVASQTMIMNGDVFSGGLPVMGANACIPMTNAGSKGERYQDEGVWKRPDMALGRKVAATSRFVFFTGEKDFNRENVKCVAEGYQKNGFKYIQYIEEPGAAHGLVSLELFEQGLDFVDAPLKESAPKDFEMAKKALAGKKLDQALVGFRKAAAHGGDAEFVAEAQTQAVELGKQYQEAVDAAQAAVDKDPKTATFAIAKLKKDWLAVSKADFDRLTAAQKAARMQKPAAAK